jgi:hypothetical protein
MGIYMDSDVGPQTWGADKASDDKSAMLKEQVMNLPILMIADFDNGLSPGIVGARVWYPGSGTVAISLLVLESRRRTLRWRSS